MKRLALILALSALSTPAWSADWTPYLKGMKDNCNTSSINTLLEKVSVDWEKKTYNTSKLPKQLRADIVKYDFDNGKFILKNATAFGHPLTAITSHEEGDSWGFGLGFANQNFMSILPQFSVSDGKITEKAGSSNKYWVSIGTYVGDVGDDDNYKYVSQESHVLPYYKGADSEILFASWYLRDLNNKDAWMHSDPSQKKELGATYNKLNPKFKQHQLPILQKFLKKQKNNPELVLETYTITPTGYRIRTDQSVSELRFDKQSKTIGCVGYFYGDIILPDYS